jgi:hypothetical protein
VFDFALFSFLFLFIGLVFDFALFSFLFLFIFSFLRTDSFVD